MRKSKFLLLLPIILVVILLPSCINVEDKEETRIYGNSVIWLKVDSNIDAFEMRWKTTDVFLDTLTYHVSYSKSDGFRTYYIKKDGSVIEETVTFPMTTKDRLWNKVHEGIDFTDEIIFTYKGKEYTTDGYIFSEQRCIEIDLKVLTFEGEFNLINHDIKDVKINMEFASKNQRHEKSILLYPTLCYYDFGRNSANGNS